MAHDLTQPLALAVDELTPSIVVPGQQTLHIVAPAELIVATDAADDWPEIADIATNPSRAFLRARFVHGGEPPNRNGHLFRTEQLVDAHLQVRHAPLNMLHRTQHVLGCFAATRMVYPPGTDAAGGDYTAAPYVETLAAMWKFAFPDEYAAVKAAHDKGLAFLSQEGLPDTVTCYECGHNAPWKGYVNDGNCEHMNQTRPVRGARWMENPLFLGGATVIPPAMPGWKDASITRIAAYVDQHPAEAEAIYEQVAAVAPHLDGLELEAVMAMLIDHANPGISADKARKVIAPMWESTAKRYPDVDFVPPADVAEAVAAALETDTRLSVPADVVVRAKNLAARLPQPPATVRRIATDLTILRPTEPRLFALWGGEVGLAWAAGIVDAMDATDAAPS